MALKAGTLDTTEFGNSMAAAIEHAFEKVWKDRYGTNLPDETRDDRRLLFVAIAQGVVKHLKDNAGSAFDVDVTVEQVDSTNLVQSTGSTISVLGVHGHSVSVTQEDDEGNRVKSEGEGLVQILTTGILY